MKSSKTYSAWNPGIKSEIPLAYRSLETIFHPDNVFTSVEEVDELARETGLKPEELVTFKPSRLALHELIIRVNADILIQEGKNEEDLGINFRTVTVHIYHNYVKPELEQIEIAYQSIATEINAMVSNELDYLLFKPEATQPVNAFSLLSRLFKKKPASIQPHKTTQEREYDLINYFKLKKQDSESELAFSVYRSLHRVLGSISTKRGFIGNDLEFLSRICSRHACNDLGSQIIGKKVGILVRQAIKDKSYPLIADADEAILISLKGASAAGKSSLRPTLRRMLSELGIESHGYGTISPDIWRRLLLNYKYLGDSYKYAGRYASHEISIIDGKLDNYRRKKAERHSSIPNLVIDRFRFDSFGIEKVTRLLLETYIRYVTTVYMFFIVTPPEATVERGWERGLERGRYKSVEDFLGHCIEAYAGMPKLLFKWLANDKPKFFFEFLDNSVAKGEYPEMIAKGTQGYMAIYKPEAFVNIERYQHINVMAKNAREVYPESEVLAIENNLSFLRQCITKIKCIDFIDPATGECFLSVHSGQFKVVDQSIFDTQILDTAFSSIVSGLSPELNKP